MEIQVIIIHIKGKKCIIVYDIPSNEARRVTTTSRQILFNS